MGNDSGVVDHYTTVRSKDSVDSRKVGPQRHVYKVSMSISSLMWFSVGVSNGPKICVKTYGKTTSVN